MLHVLDAITNRIAAIAGGERIVLYGSWARGDHCGRSDIDLAVEAPAAAWRQAYFYLMYEAPTLLRIDVTRLDTAPLPLRRQIERDGITLFERNAFPADSLCSAPPLPASHG